MDIASQANVFLLLSSNQAYEKPNLESKLRVKMFTKFFYIQIRENQFDIRNIETGESFQLSAKPEFSHPRMLIGNFTSADACLKSLMKKARGSGFTLTTKVVIHPVDKVEGGLSQIEERVLRELAIGSGGTTKVVVWIGAKLSDSEVVAKLKLK